jgi:hypothetical protein
MSDSFEKLQTTHSHVPKIITTVTQNGSELLVNKHWEVLKWSRQNKQDSRKRIVFVDVKKENEEFGYRSMIRIAAQNIYPEFIFLHTIDPYDNKGHEIYKWPLKLVIWTLSEKNKDLLIIQCIVCNNFIKLHHVQSLVELDKLWIFHNSNMQNGIVVNRGDPMDERNGINLIHLYFCQLFLYHL